MARGINDGILDAALDGDDDDDDTGRAGDGIIDDEEATGILDDDRDAIEPADG